MSSKNIPEPEGSERITYQGKIIEIVEQDMRIGDKLKTFEKARRAPGTRLIVFSSPSTLRLTKEFRSELNNGTGGYDIRLPGRKVFDIVLEYNEALKNNVNISKVAESTAIKEAREELGIIPYDLQYIHVSHAGATVEWDLYYFLITEYEELASQELELGEDIEIVDFSLDEVWDMCITGKISEDRSVAVLMKLLAKKLNK